MTTMLSVARPSPQTEEETFAPKLHSPPSTSSVMTEQLRLTGLLLRAAGVLYAMLLIVGIALPIVAITRSAQQSTHSNGGTNFTFTPEMSVIIAFVALFVPLFVWRDEEPTRRDYLWLMPVSRRTHTLARVVAGWAWTMVATLMYVVAIVLLSIIAQQLRGAPQPYHPGFSPWEWLVPFSAATVAYALASVAAVLTQRPLIWIFGTVAIYGGAIMLLMNFGMLEAAMFLLRGMNGGFGLRAAIYGTVVSSDGLSAPSLWHWAGATAVWGGAALALLWFAASRRLRD